MYELKHIKPCQNIGKVFRVNDLCINVSSNCSFDFHIPNLAKRTKHLTDWMLRTFFSRQIDNVYLI